MIAAIGNLSLDVVAGAAARPGGTVYYSSLTLAHLGVDARVAASCAREDREELLPLLEATGLPVAWHESAVTTRYRFHYEGDHRIMWQDAVGDPWTPAQAVEAVGDAAWVHVGALARSDFPADTLAALADGGRRLLVDAQGLVRAPALGRLQTDARIGDVLRHVAILKVDDEEADTLVGSRQPEALRRLCVPEVILTLGSRGSFVVAEGRADHLPAPVPDAPDPTGAGDTFSAAYLAARAGGAEPRNAAAAATRTVAAFLSRA